MSNTFRIIDTGVREGRANRSLYQPIIQSGRIVPRMLLFQLVQSFTDLNEMEYKDQEFSGKDICESRDIKVIYNGRDHSFSSSSLRKRVAEGEK